MLLQELMGNFPLEDGSEMKGRLAQNTHLSIHEHEAQTQEPNTHLAPKGTLAHIHIHTDKTNKSSAMSIRAN